jgi:hypothetical protein
MAPTVPGLLMLLAVSTGSIRAGTPSDNALVHIHRHVAPVENGKTFDMDFDEIERKGNRSTVRITLRSGGSVSGPMFELAGQCAIAKSRHARYFRNLTKADEGNANQWTYIVGFADSLDGPGLELPPGQRGHTVAEDSVDDATFAWSRDDCRLLGFAH